MAGTLPPREEPVLDEDGLVNLRWYEFFTRAGRIPLGGLYFSTNSTDPASTLGYGTWTAFGAGRVFVGFSSGETEFDTDEETGGEKTHTLTSAEMPSHLHAVGASNLSNTTVTGAGLRVQTLVNAGGGTDPASSATAGSGGAHNNLQPYIVVRAWKRTG